jgi:hypothetical protein
VFRVVIIVESTVSVHPMSLVLTVVLYIPFVQGMP